MTFFCQADDIFEKSVEQSRFEQMHFEQLTLTRLNDRTEKVFFSIFKKICYCDDLYLIDVN
jgi:hypothetical protein